jgi:hypothetical protein
VKSSHLVLLFHLLTCYFAVASHHLVSLHTDVASDESSRSTRSNGYAAAKAYMVYGGSTYLELAEEAWRTASGYTISSSQAQVGNIPGKNFRLNNSCAGGMSGSYPVVQLFLMQSPFPLVGGTFYVSRASVVIISGFAHQCISNRRRVQRY